MEIENYENYLIYPNGKIWSKYYNKFLKDEVNHNGYLRVRLSKNPIENKKFFVHRLVALTYISNPNNLPFVNHIDQNKQNNSVENLEWCSALYNCQSIRRNTNLGCIYLEKGIITYQIYIEKKCYKWRYKTLEEAECQRILMKSMLSN
jgi:hypothetical protein